MDIDILKDLSKMELIALNHQIVEELKRREEQETKADIRKFKVGDKVAFESDGQELFGIVIRVNRKSVTIDTYGFGQWRISPQLVKRNLSSEVSSKKKKGKKVHHLFGN